jgi:hypothetical protein
VDQNDDLKYQDVINTLRQLQQVKAPSGFEADLIRRINSEKSPAEKTLWQNIFIPSRLIPSAALALTAILLIFVLNHSGIHQDNPLLTPPRERQDVTLSAKTDRSITEGKTLNSDEVSAMQENTGIQGDKDKTFQDKAVEESGQKGKEIRPSVSGNLAGKGVSTDKFITANFASSRITDYPVNKAGLNFRQVNLSNEQKIELNQLKEKMESMYKARVKQ